MSLYADHYPSIHITKPQKLTVSATLTRRSGMTTTRRSQPLRANRFGLPRLGGRCPGLPAAKLSRRFRTRRLTMTGWDALHSVTISIHGGTPCKILEARPALGLLVLVHLRRLRRSIRLHARHVAEKGTRPVCIMNLIALGRATKAFLDRA